MSATQHGTQGLPDPAPVVTKEWTYDMGSVVTHEWPLGTPADMQAQFDVLAAEGNAGSGLAQLNYRASNGRASLVARFARVGQNTAGYGSDVTVVEELYGVDVLKDIDTSPYFEELTDDEVSWIQYCVDNNFTDAQISSEADRLNVAAGLSYSMWTTKMKEYRYHLKRGGQYFETMFILRRSLYGVKTSSIKANFTGINTKVTAPEFKSQMDDLIAALPEGEWLYKPPQVEHLGRGKWRVSLEWMWAKKWSVVYGGSWGDLS